MTPLGFVSAVGATVAAFCLWLTVRIVNRRERWAKRTAIALVVAALAYPLSVGPVFRLSYWIDPSQEASWTVVAVSWYCVPFALVVETGPDIVRGLATKYLDLWLPPQPEILFDGDTDKVPGGDIMR
jgi:hypothetical protein